MVFTTGYQANLGAISTLAGPDDFLIIDADSHASIYDACKLGSATVIRFKHNDPADLDKRLARLADQPGNKIVVVEGIYSMLGDHAPLKEFVAVTKKHSAYILVDEAHSMGVMGKTGQGVVEHDGVLDQVDFITGTFSKSMGAIGGFLVSNMEDFDDPARRLPSLHVHGLAAAGDCRFGAHLAGQAPCQSGPDGQAVAERRHALLRCPERRASRLASRRARSSPSTSPIRPWPPRLACAAAQRRLCQFGAAAGDAVRYRPAPLLGFGRAFGTEQLQHVVEILTQIGRELGILEAPAAHAVAA